MAYTTEQESWILNQIKKERKQLQDDSKSLLKYDFYRCEYSRSQASKSGFK